MTAKKHIPLIILMMAFLLSACHVVESPVQTKKLPLLGLLQLKLPKMPTRPLTAAQIEATTTALVEKGIPHMKSELSFEPQADSPVYFIQGSAPAAVQNFAYPDAACQWMGVAGQVFDKAGAPVANLVINVGGVLNGTPIDLVGMTGTTQVYGPRSYEVKIGDQASDSHGSLWMQLSNTDGFPVSPRFSFPTYSDCTKNLVVLNFVEVDKITTINFPLISNP